MSISNMFHDNGESIALTEEQFFTEMQRRKDKLKWSKNDVIIGCPLCNSDPIPVDPTKKDSPPAYHRHRIRRSVDLPDPEV